MSSLSDRKKSRNARRDAVKLKAVVGDTKKSYDDPRIWSCKRNEAGLGAATIRFLEPSDKDVKFHIASGMEEDEVPFFVKKHTHGFKGVGNKWYIENCPTSVVERECPVCQDNSALVDASGGWNEMDDKSPEKATVRNRKRKEAYYANILVIKDRANPENEGKVKIFRYGKAIHTMIMDKLVPEFEDQESVDVSNFWEGSTLNLKITKKDGWASYEKSTWAKVAPLGKDAEIEAVLKEMFTLTDFIADSEYKSFEKLSERLTLVDPSHKAVKSEESVKEEVVAKEPVAEDEVKVVAPKEEPAGNYAVSEDDAYFASLLED